LLSTRPRLVLAGEVLVAGRIVDRLGRFAALLAPSLKIAIEPRLLIAAVIGIFAIELGVLALAIIGFRPASADNIRARSCAD
jgi:hypothetical protein